MNPPRPAAAAAVALAVAAWGCSPASGRPDDGRSARTADAAVEVVLFGDYACGPCADFGRRLRPLLDSEGRRVRLVFRFCPSSRHPEGRAAAELAAAAVELGRFWELHWALVEAGPIYDEEAPRELAEGMGLDLAELDRIVATGRPAAAVDEDLALADRMGVLGTPTTFVDGRRLDGAVATERVAGAIAAARLARR